MECSRNKGASPYSYHTFLFPFRWEHDEGKHDMDLFYERLQDGKWACSKDEPNLLRYIAQNYRFRLSDTDLDDDQRILLAYNEYKYFHTSARIAIYGEGEGKEIVHNYLRRFESGYDSHLRIKKDDIEYLLHVNSINLRVYNTGVAILMFQAEYYGDKMVNNEVKRTPNLDDVLAINQYGRRVCPPFISLKAGEGCSELADRLTLVIDGKEICEDFNVVLSNPEQHPNYISKIVMETLGESFSFQKQMNSSKALRKRTFFRKFCCARKRGEGEKTIYIEPIIDDRMFVISVVRDNRLIEQMQKWLANENRYLYEHDAFADSSMKLYQFMFVDTRSPSCADRRMRLELIKNYCYSRWVEEGTLYGITHQAFVCLTSQSDFGENAITAHVLTIYTQMLALVLAQRASFIQFNNETSMLSRVLPKEMGDFEVFNYPVSNLINLQEKYSSFQGRIMNFEVTAQEQGIEMYKMMQRALYVSEEAEELDSQLDIVQNTVNTVMERRREVQIALLTILGLLATAASLDDIVLVSVFLALVLIVVSFNYKGKGTRVLFTALIVIVGLVRARKSFLLDVHLIGKLLGFWRNP